MADLQLPRELQPYAPLIQATAARYGLDPALWAGLLMYESGGRADARNADSGATGLGQVMPREAGFPGRPTVRELLDPATNLDWSARILSDGIRRYGQIGGVAAYLGAVDPKTGQPTNAMDANGTTGHTYVRNVFLRAAQYGYTPNQPTTIGTGTGGTGGTGTGAPTVADPATDPRVIEATRQQKAAEARLNALLERQRAAQELVAKYNAESSIPETKWFPANGFAAPKLAADGKTVIYDPKWQATKDAASDDPELGLGKQIDAARELADKAGTALAAAQADAAKTSTITAPSTRQGPGGAEYQWDAAQGQWVPAPGMPAPPAAAKRTQVVGTNLIDLDTGAVIGTVPRDAASKRTQLIGTQLIDLDTGQVIADLTNVVRSADRPTTTTYGGRVYPNDPTTGLPSPGTGVDLMTPEERAAAARQLALQGLGSTTVDGRLITYDPTRPEGEQVTGRIDLLDPTARARADEESQLDLAAKRRAAQPQFQDPRAAYQFQAQQAQQQARAYSEVLKQQVASGMKTWEQVKQELSNWWEGSMAPALAGYRAQAEQQQYRDQLQLDAAQRAEDDRVAEANRRREEAAYQAGEQERTTWRGLAPMARSNEFVQQYAENVGKMARGERVDFSPAALTAPVALPSFDQMAQQGAARALAAISPTAARQIGRPLPAIPDLQGLDLNALLPPYQPAAS